MNQLELLSTICEETRFSILGMLRNNAELSVNDITQRANRDQALISHHLRILRECGLVVCRSQGRRSLYRIYDVEISSIMGDILESCSRMSNLCAKADSPKV